LHCSKCGAQNVDGSQFCNKCGANLAPQPTVSQPSNDAIKSQIDEARRKEKIGYGITVVSIILLLILWAAVGQGGGNGNDDIKILVAGLVVFAFIGVIASTYWNIKKIALMKKLK